MKKYLTFVFIILSLVSFVACGRFSGTEEVFSSTAFFGTYVEIALYSDGNAQSDKDNLSRAKAEMIQTLTDIQDALDADGEDADIARFNALRGGGKIAVTKFTAECFDLARALYGATGGAYNPTVYGLVDLWGFSSRVLSGEGGDMPYDRQEPSVPSQKYIDAFKGLTDFEGVTLVEESDGYYLVKPADCVTVDGEEYFLRMDFGGICKGYAGDKLKEIADKYGVKKGYFLMGQSSITFLDSPDGNGYDLDMENPLDPSQALFTKKDIKNQSISVSGDYQRYFEEGGKRYCHIIDCATGYPVSSEISAVFAQCESSAVCDAVTTALMTMSAEEIARISQSREFVELGVKSVSVVKQTQRGFQVLSNAQKLSVSSGVERLKFEVTADEVKFVRSVDKGWIFALIFVMAVVVVVVALADKNKKEGKPFAQYPNAFFARGDLAVYLLLAVAIAGVFLGVGLTFKKSTLKSVQVYCGDSLVALYDVKRQEITLSADWQGQAEYSQEKGKIILTVYHDAEKTKFNKVEFADGQARMTQATCFGKDCTKTFCRVYNANQTVFCMPHDLRIVGVGEGNKGVR